MEQLVNTYGLRPGQGTQADYDRSAFARRFTPDRGCLPRIDLFKKIAGILLPGHFEYHAWTERLLYGVCTRTLVGLPGCAGSAKTYNISNFAAVWWLCDPAESSVILVSTTRESLRKRAWSEISRCYCDAPPELRGTFVDSRMIWNYDYGDARHAIFGKAVEEGSVTKVADDIKGIHTRRQMVVIDEATSVPEAIFDACSNLFSYPEEFLLVVIGNPRNRLDQFSKYIEPAEGWTSVTVDDEEWEGKPQHEYGGSVPLVIRFDAEKSPNITEGRIVSRHLPLPHTVEARKKAAGGQTPLWWSNFRGFPPPEGICKTVFSESVIDAQHGFSSFEFSGESFQILGGFDHARNGGDRPALRFAKMGLLSDGKLAVEWMPPIVLNISALSTVPIDFQLSEQVRLHCEHFVYRDIDYHCPFENLAVDATGEGAGFADILQRTVSARILRVQFSAAASDDAASLEDIRPASEVYENKRVEMYFRARDMLNHGQLRGIDRETAVELCSLEFDDTSRRIKLQAKRDYKKKFRKSPDFADSAVLCCEAARLRGLRLVPLGETKTRYEDFDNLVHDCQSVFVNVDYSPETFDD
jgi:hypothetical protein